jgi:hypothetical protein
MVVLIELVLIGIWGWTLMNHGARLLRLARIHHGWDRTPLKATLHRAWFWLGREEFWQSVRLDSMRCLQLTLMVFALAYFTNI